MHDAPIGAAAILDSTKDVKPGVATAESSVRDGDYDKPRWGASASGTRTRAAAAKRTVTGMKVGTATMGSVVSDKTFGAAARKLWQTIYHSAQQPSEVLCLMRHSAQQPQNVL